MKLLEPSQKTYFFKIGTKFEFLHQYLTLPPPSLFSRPDDERGRTRRRVKNPLKWLRTKRAAMHNAGKEYTNGLNKKIAAKKVHNWSGKQCCNCKFKCSVHIIDAERELLFKGFYEASKEQKQHFIEKNTICKPRTKNLLHHINKKKVNYSYFLTERRVQVCKSFFLGTLNIGGNQVYNLHNKKDPVTGLPQPDGRGKKTKSNISEEDEKFIVDHIKEFPAVESHYGRGDSTKMYLAPSLNLTIMYELYVQLCIKKGRRVLSDWVYRKIFNTTPDLNREFGQKSVDKCGVCSEFDNKIEANCMSAQDWADSETHKELEEKYRRMKKADMKIRREDTAVLTFDLQNVITCPRAGVKDLFYYRKLTVYNLTGQTQTFKDRKFEKKTHCVVWHECQAGRGGNEIASSVSKLLQDIVQNNPLVTKIITWSDSCVPQNKNSFMSTAVLSFLHSNPRISFVTMKFSLPGHSWCQEVDNIHSQLEQYFKLHPFYSPVTLLPLIRGANRHEIFHVLELKTPEVLNFGAVAHNLEFTKVPFARVHCIRFERTFFVQFKIHHYDPFTTVNVNANENRINRIFFNDLSELHLNLRSVEDGPLMHVLGAAKILDLQKMFRWMRPEDIAFYNSIGVPTPPPA